MNSNKFELYARVVCPHGGTGNKTERTRTKIGKGKPLIIDVLLTHSISFGFHSACICFCMYILRFSVAVSFNVRLRCGTQHITQSYIKLNSLFSFAFRKRFIHCEMWVQTHAEWHKRVHTHIHTSIRCHSTSVYKQNILVHILIFS